MQVNSTMDDYLPQGRDIGQVSLATFYHKLSDAFTILQQG